MEQLPKSFEFGNLEKEMTAHFGDKIKIYRNLGRKYVVSSRATLTNVDMQLVNDESSIKLAALLLRKIIFSIEKHKIDRDVTVDKLIEGECKIPPISVQFFSVLLSGGDVDKIKDPRTVLKAKSFAYDVSAAHRGQVKSSKHITLGLTLKSLTGSEKIVRLLHSFGHCISYTLPKPANKLMILNLSIRLPRIKIVSAFMSQYFLKGISSNFFLYSFQF